MIKTKQAKCILAMICALAAAPAIAAKTTYICKVDDKNSGVIQPDLVVRYDDASNDVIVFDALIRHFDGGPKAGKISEKTSKKQVFQWSVTQSNRRGQQTVMRYRAAIYMTGKIIVTAKPHGYSNNFISRGTCKINNRYKFPSS